MKREKDQTGLKSALDLALERMSQAGGGSAALSDEQKKSLAEIERSIQAKIAETEIMMAQAVAAARAQGNVEEAAKVDLQKREEIFRIRRRGEDDKERIRSGG